MDGYWRESGRADNPGERGEQSSKPPERPPAGWPNLEAASTEKLLQAMGYDWEDLTSEASDLPRESQEAVDRFDPRQANLPDLSREEAADYIRDNGETRPWLKPAERSAPEVQHVVATVDQGGGHAVERHEGFTAGERNERRVDGLEDPAQLDPTSARRARTPNSPIGCMSAATSPQRSTTLRRSLPRSLAEPRIQMFRLHLGDRGFRTNGPNLRLSSFRSRNCSASKAPTNAKGSGCCLSTAIFGRRSQVETHGSTQRLNGGLTSPHRQRRPSPARTSGVGRSSSSSVRLTITATGKSPRCIRSRETGTSHCCELQGRLPQREHRGAVLLADQYDPDLS